MMPAAPGSTRAAPAVAAPAVAAPAPAESVSDGFRRRADELFPGGVNSPVRAHRAVEGEPPIIARGAGPMIWDADGTPFLDYIGAFGPLILGHAPASVVAAAEAAVRAGGPFGATSPEEVELGELIRSRMPGIERVRFVSSGTEAAMSALRVARAATGRDLILKFEGGYHGHADALLAEAGSGLATLALPGSAGVTPEVAGQTLIAPYNDVQAVRTIADAHPDRIAAIIVEPIAANMGVVPPEPGFLEGLRELTSRLGALLVFDEVITGFRVAPGGAQERFGIRPDLTILGKIIGGGFPVGAYGGRRELLDLVAPAGPVYQAGTLSGHPVSMAAGMATLQALDAASYAELERRGAALEAGLREAAAGAGRADVSVTRVASLLTLFFRPAPPRNFQEALEAETAAFARFHAGMRQAGILLPPSAHEAWFLSLAHTDADVDRTVGAARVALRS